MPYKKELFRISLLISVLICWITGFSQTNINSPYSRFGIGEISNNRNSYFAAMAGTSLAIRNPFHINSSNPASYAFFDSLSFVFEGGVYGNFSRANTDSLSVTQNYASLTGLQFGFPVNRWWKASFGLLPLSNVGYNIKVDVSDPEVGNTRYNYEGSGGLNKFYLGNGFKLSNNFSIGFNAIYVFGTMDQTRYISFPDSIFYLNTQLIKSTSLHDFHFDMGFQYFKKIGKGLEAGIGGYYSLPSSVSGEKNYLVRSFFGTPGSSTSYRDTILDRNEGTGDFKLPMGFGGGLSLAKKGSWVIGADVQWKNWEKFSNFGVSDSLTNSLEIKAGGEILPAASALSEYWKRIAYRFGVHYNKTNIKLYGNQINEFGISFGFGFPIVRSFSAINTNFEFGRAGTLDNGLIQSSFFRFTISVSVYERWFLKRKYF